MLRLRVVGVALVGLASVLPACSADGADGSADGPGCGDEPIVAFNRNGEYEGLAEVVLVEAGDGGEDGGDRERPVGLDVRTCG